MIRLFKALGWVLIIPIIAYLFLFLVRDDSGLVLLSGTLPGLGLKAATPFSIALTFTGFLFFTVLFFVLGYLLLRLAIHLLNLPKYFGHYRKKRKELASERRFARAQLALIEHNPRLAEDLFLAATKFSANTSLCYIGAAKAAQMQEKIEQRDLYLAAIDQSEDKDNAILAGIYRAELWIEVQAFKKAQLSLETMRETTPNHHRILALLAKTYQHQGLFDQLFDIMPALHNALPKSDRKEVEADLYIDLIDYIGRKNDANLLKEIWNNIPKDLKSTPGVVINYAEKLLYCGEADEAEAILRQALKKNFDDLVMTAYGHLFRGNLALQLKQAKGFLRAHPQSAYAALAVSRLALRSNNLSEALNYVNEALTIDAGIADGYHLLAEIKVTQGDNAGAVSAYREASRLTYAKPSAELLQVEGEYFAAPAPLTKLSHNAPTTPNTEEIIEAETTTSEQEEDTQSAATMNQDHK